MRVQPIAAKFARFIVAVAEECFVELDVPAA
jgi:hypothetical protein